MPFNLSWQENTREHVEISKCLRRGENVKARKQFGSGVRVDCNRGIEISERLRGGTLTSFFPPKMFNVMDTSRSLLWRSLIKASYSFIITGESTLHITLWSHLCHGIDTMLVSQWLLIFFARETFSRQLNR